MNYAMALSAASALIVFLLGMVAWFLNRLINQNDATHIENKGQFKELIDEVKEVKTALQEHKGDVEVIKEKIEYHAKGLEEVSNLAHRVRIVENDLAVLNDRRAKH